MELPERIDGIRRVEARYGARLGRTIIPSRVYRSSIPSALRKTAGPSRHLPLSPLLSSRGTRAFENGRHARQVNGNCRSSPTTAYLLLVGLHCELDSQEERPPPKLIARAKPLSMSAIQSLNAGLAFAPLVVNGCGGKAFALHMSINLCQRSHFNENSLRRCDT